MIRLISFAVFLVITPMAILAEPLLLGAEDDWLVAYTPADHDNEAYCAIQTSTSEGRFSLMLTENNPAIGFLRSEKLRYSDEFNRGLIRFWVDDNPSFDVWAYGKQGAVALDGIYQTRFVDDMYHGRYLWIDVNNDNRGDISFKASGFAKMANELIKCVEKL